MVSRKFELIRSHLGLEDEDRFGTVSVHIVEYLDTAKYPEPFSYIFEGVQKKLPYVVERGIKAKLKSLTGMGVLVAYESDKKIKHDKITPKKIGDGAILFALNPEYK